MSTPIHSGSISGPLRILALLALVLLLPTHALAEEAAPGVAPEASAASESGSAAGDSPSGAAQDDTEERIDDL